MNLHDSRKRRRGHLRKQWTLRYFRFCLLALNTFARECTILRCDFFFYQNGTNVVYIDLPVFYQLVNVYSIASMFLTSDYSDALST